MTTIITTHYVDEARGANRVGFLRAGRLLAEDSPQVLDNDVDDHDDEDTVLIEIKRAGCWRRTRLRSVMILIII